MEIKDIEKILGKQLQLLSEESECASTDELCRLSEQMRAIALILLRYGPVGARAE